METELEKYILDYMRNPNKLTRVKMPNWLKSQTRPSTDSIIAWEIYSKSLFEEKKVIQALKILEGKFLIESFYKGNIFEKVIWYRFKTDD